MPVQIYLHSILPTALHIKTIPNVAGIDWAKFPPVI